MKKRMNGTTSSSNNAGFKRVMLTLVVLLLSATLMVGAVSAADPVPVYTESDLTSNLSDTDVTEIKLMGDIVIEKPLFINHSVKIDGNHKFITADNESGNFVHTGSHSDGKNCYHLLCIINTSANLDIAIKNVTFDNDGDAYGLHFWSNKKDVKQNLTLENVWIIDSQGSGLTMRGVNVSATGLTIENSGWGQSIDIQSVSTFTSLLQIDTLNGLKDGVKISDEGVDYPGQVYVNGDKTSHDFVLYPGNTAKRFVWASSQEAVYPGKYVALVGVGVDNSVPLLYADLTNATSSSDAKNVTLLRDVVLDEPLTIDQAITFDGNQKTLTLNHGAGKTAITASAAVTLENFTIVASKDAAFGTAIKLNGDNSKLINNFIDLEDLHTESDKTDGRLSSIAVFVAKTGAEITDNVIIAGNSETSSSQCIVVSTGNTKIEGNVLITGSAKDDFINSADGSTSSGSIAVRISGASATANVTGNAIFSGEFSQENLEALFDKDVFSDEVVAQLQAINTDTSRHVAFAIDGSNTAGAEIIANGNLIVLSSETQNSDGNPKYGTVVYLNDEGTSESVNITLTNNEVVGANYLIFADDATKSATSAGVFTVKGSIINNNFQDITIGLVKHEGVTVTFDDDEFKWNLTTAKALTADDDYKPVVDGQINVAGNYWAWSANQAGTPSGYMVLTTPGTYGVGDLMPLVAVDTTPTVTIKETANMSIALGDTGNKILTAELAGVKDAAFVWTVEPATPTLIQLLKADGTTAYDNTAVSSIAYKLSGATEGTVTLKAAYADNPAINTTVTITVYNVISEEAAVGAVTEIKSTDAGTKIQVNTNTGSTVSKILNESGVEVTYGSVEEAKLVLDDGTSVRFVFEGGTGTVNNGVVSGTVTNMYLESNGTVTAPATLPITITYELSTEVKTAESLKDKTARPGINPNLDASVEAKLNNKYVTTLGGLDAFMTAGNGLEQFNKMLTGEKIEMTFKINDPTRFIDHTKLKVLHISDDGKVTTAPVKVAAKRIGVDIYITISGSSYSSYVLVQDKTPQNTGGSDSSSTGTSEWLTDSSSQPTQQPTDKPTDKPTDTVPTDVPTTSKPTEEPSSPGFGILAALAGLGAVAILRRK